MKIMFTGGHHNSALVIATELTSSGQQVFWVGQKHPIINSSHLSAEYQEVSQANIPFFNLTTGKFQPNYNFIPYLIRIPVGFIQSFWILLKVRPDLVFSFGGYVALPVALVAKLLGIRIYTHEQTVLPRLGLANRIISMVADKVFVSFPPAVNRNKANTVYTGLPLRQSIYGKKKIFDNKHRTIYITGGKQGGHKINKVVFQILPKLLSFYNVIHQCGSNTEYRDIDKAAELKNRLKEKSKNYYISEYFTKEEIGPIFSSADLVIGRAGAHTVYEMLTLEKPSIMIPIPWTHFDEQTKNAEYLVNSGLAEILPEHDLNADILYKKITQMFSQYDKYKIKSSYRVPKNADKIIVKEILSLADKG